jgi:death-on-curing protein
MSDYLTLAEVLAIHADQIERYGGSPGVRDRRLLSRLSIGLKRATTRM